MAMMDLTNDAETIVVTEDDISGKNLNKNVLQKIEDDLDIDEKISIMFLMAQNHSAAFQNVFDLFKKAKNQNAYVLTEFVNSYPENWKNRLLEALCVIQNRQVIRKLGIPFDVLDITYPLKSRLCARHLNPVAKCLYMLCEALSDSQIESLVDSVKADIINYEADLHVTDCLELHLLYWINVKYISFNSDGRVSLSNLLKHLKKLDELELIYNDLKKCENHQNVLDTHNTSVKNVRKLQNFSVSEETRAGANNVDEHTVKIQKGLCIIFNQMSFSGQKYETRFGTTADCEKLTQTFQGFGFDVFRHTNLKKDELLQKMEDIPKDFGVDYDCVFVCLLSHGCKGSIIASDEEEVTIEMIENKMCSYELQDVIKIVIIQACQGQTTGKIQGPLTTDGPGPSSVSNIAPYRNFCVFMSTMQGFVSVRHKAEGSWFIQELCAILQKEGGKLTFTQITRRICQSVEKKRGKLDGANSVAQLPELRPCRLLVEFQLPEYRPPQ